MKATESTPKRNGPKPRATAGLNNLDQDRAASVADEGGATAATLEGQEPAPDSSPKPGAARSKRRDRANLRH